MFFSKKGFTLIEILIVIIIISIVVSASIPAFRKARAKSLNVKTQSLISSIEAALSMYESDFGDYPPSDEKKGNKILVELLQGPVSSDFWKGPYMRFKKEDLDTKGNIVDPWFTPLIYQYPQNQHENTPYVIISAGPDRKLGTGDDIGNW